MASFQKGGNDGRMSHVFEALLPSKPLVARLLAAIRQLQAMRAFTLPMLKPSHTFQRYLEGNNGTEKREPGGTGCCEVVHVSGL